MTTPDITIPAEARKGAWDAFVDASINAGLSSEECLHAACLAMINAWPGMEKTTPFSVWRGEYIFLPLPQETPDDH